MKISLLLYATLIFSGTALAESVVVTKPGSTNVRETVPVAECSAVISPKLPGRILSACMDKCQAGGFKRYYGGLCSGARSKGNAELNASIFIGSGDLLNVIGGPVVFGISLNCASGSIAAELVSPLRGSHMAGEESPYIRPELKNLNRPYMFAQFRSEASGQGRVAITYDSKERALKIAIKDLVIGASEDGKSYVQVLTAQTTYSRLNVDLALTLDSKKSKAESAADEFRDIPIKESSLVLTFNPEDLKRLLRDSDSPANGKMPLPLPQVFYYEGNFGEVFFDARRWAWLHGTDSNARTKGYAATKKVDWQRVAEFLSDLVVLSQRQDAGRSVYKFSQYINAYDECTIPSPVRP